MDNTTVSETIRKGEPSVAQLAVNEVNDWSKKNLFQLNNEKTKELIINFCHAQVSISPTLYKDGTPIAPVSSVKLLRLTINSKLTWNDHVEDLVKKTSRKLYFLAQLKRAKVPVSDLIAYYCACTRSAIDYSCPVHYHALSRYLVFHPLADARLDFIQDHHEFLMRKLFISIIMNSDNKLNSLIPNKKSNSKYNLRKERKLDISLTKTKRFSDSFIIKNCRIYNNV